MSLSRSLNGVSWRTIGDVSIFLPLKNVLEGLYSFTWYREPLTSGQDGFGPVSQERNTDFTILFQDSILLILPTCVLILLCLLNLFEGRQQRKNTLANPGANMNEKLESNSPASVDPNLLKGGQLFPKENHLSRFRILFWTKLVTYALQTCLFLTLAIISSFNKGRRVSPARSSQADIAGFSVSALGAVLAGWLSFRSHLETWRSNLSLQIVLVGWTVVLAIRARTEWTLGPGLGSRTEFAMLVAAIALCMLSALAESFARITSKRKEAESISPELLTNLFTYATLSFAQPFFSQAFSTYRRRETPGASMLWPLAADLECTDGIEEFERLWGNELKKSTTKQRKPKLWRIIFKMHARSFLAPFILCIIYSVAQYASPSLLNGFLNWLSSPNVKSRPIFEGIRYALGLLAIRIITACLNGVIAYQLGREVIRVRALLIAAVYRKLLRLSPSEKGKRTIGDIVSHVNVDAEAICDGSWYIQIIFMAIPCFALGIWFLYQQLRWVAFVGVGFILLVLGGTQGFNSRAMAVAYGARLKELDQRTTLVDEAITNVKLVKFSAWEGPLQARVMELRKLELKYLKKMANVFGRILLPSNVARGGTLILMFVLYTVKIGTPTASTIFVSLSIFDLLYVPIEQAGFTLNWLLNTKKSVSRIREFLAGDELEADAFEVNSSLSDEGLAAKIDNGLFTWTKPQPGNNDSKTTGNEKARKAADSEKSSKAEGLELNIPHFTVRKGELMVILGRVGSGKSSLLEALIGQMHRIRGNVVLAGRQTAYSPQSPFILAGTIQDNIVGFDLPLNPELLNRVVEACALQDDLHQLPGGLQCEIGEKGINLSGGQRSRISLARACYSALSGQAKLLLLDSVLEAVDAETDAYIWRRVIGKEGLLKNHARVIVTHSAHHLAGVDRVCYMEGGQICQVGTHEELMQVDGQYLHLIAEFATPTKQRSANDVETRDSINKVPGKVASVGTGRLTDEEAMELGRISGKTYATFIRYAGWHRIIIVISLLILLRAINIGSQFWLSYWIGTEDAVLGRHPALYLGIYGGLVVITIITTPMMIVVVARYIIFEASSKLYSRMVESVLRAPLSWFNVTPSGRITARLSSDLAQIDWDFVGILASFLAIATNILSGVVASAISTKGLLLTALPILLPLYWMVFVYYTATSRTVRRLDAGKTRAPVLSQAGESVQGGAVLRAINAVGYMDSFYKKVDSNQSAKLMQYVAQGWLNVRMEGLAAVLVFSVTAFVVGLRHSISPAIGGLAVSSMLAISNYLSNFVATAARLETSAVHAERCIEYAESLPSEAPASLPSDDLLDAWPQNGRISFQNVSARYRPDLPLSLKGVFLEIIPASKFAIVGRTGSGKSSMTLTLFRLLELTDGKIEIDGVDTSTLGLNKLRKAIGIIPQENQGFQGTIRSNLNPFAEHEDKELWQALEDAQLKDFVSGLEGGLDAPVSIGGSNLSAGQLQQLGLARALLQRTPVVVLDEATSSLDLETDSIVQRTIRKSFANATVITIAHRISTILDSDMVVVMDAGTVAEVGPPSELLKREGGLFATLVREAGLDA